MNIEKLISYIREHKKVTIPEVQQKFNLKYGQTREVFRQLETDGKIRYAAGVVFEWNLPDEKDRLELIKQRRKEFDELQAKLAEQEMEEEEDEDIDELLKLLDDDEDDELDWKESTATVEAPQPIRELVALDDMLNCDEFKKSKGKLTFVVGKDSKGKDIVADLAGMPNLLVAGTTGAGKSIALHSLIISLAQKYSPDYVKLLLVDTKLVEMSFYDGMPHLLTRQSINTCNDALNALDYLTEEMERRYGLFRTSGVGNVVEYNKQSKTQLPYIVCVIDEIADIMSSDKRLFEVRILRLAQKCRAAGIHLVLATQRPDVKIITGTIKTAMPARIALRVCTMYDSITILGHKGAEQLLGRGDMLLYDSVSAEPIRVQGAFASIDDIRAVVKEFKAKYVCKFDKEIENRIFGAKKWNATTATSIAQTAQINNSQADPLCRKALRFWLEKQGGRASIASIQRNLGIGFNRAGRIMDYCQQMGYVEQPGPNEPIAKPLMVLIIIDDLPILFPDQED